MSMLFPKPDAAKAQAETWKQAAIEKGFTPFSREERSGE